MLKLEIKMDERIIADERKYTAESIYQALEKIFSKQNFRMETREDGSLVFYGNGHPRDGSHGCINMRPADAEKLYQLIDYGTPAIVHF